MQQNSELISGRAKTLWASNNLFLIFLCSISGASEKNKRRKDFHGTVQLKTKSRLPGAGVIKRHFSFNSSSEAPKRRKFHARYGVMHFVVERFFVICVVHRKGRKHLCVPLSTFQTKIGFVFHFAFSSRITNSVKCTNAQWCSLIEEFFYVIHKLMIATMRWIVMVWRTFCRLVIMLS